MTPSLVISAPCVRRGLTTVRSSVVRVRTPTRHSNLFWDDSSVPSASAAIIVYVRPSRDQKRIVREMRGIGANILAQDNGAASTTSTRAVCASKLLTLWCSNQALHSRFTLGSDAARNAKAVSGEASTLTSALTLPVIRHFPIDASVITSSSMAIMRRNGEGMY